MISFRLLVTMSSTAVAACVCSAAVAQSSDIDGPIGGGAAAAGEMTTLEQRRQRILQALSESDERQWGHQRITPLPNQPAMQWETAAYRVHLGGLPDKSAKNGSDLHVQLVKHEVRMPEPNRREEHIVTRHRIYSNGKPRYVVAQSFIRLTLQSPNQMYLQAKKRNFDDQGRLENEVLMAGTLTRQVQKR